MSLLGESLALSTKLGMRSLIEKVLSRRDHLLKVSLTPLASS